MTSDFEQGDHEVVDASATAEQLAELGSMEAVKESGAFDELMAQIDTVQIELSCKDGLIQQIIRADLERGLQAELTGHLGYDKHAVEGRGSDNSRNGQYSKTVSTVAGDLEVVMPRDRAGTFAPRLVLDIAYHLESTVDTELSHDTISSITDAVLDEMTAWQNRPLGAFYPILYLDAIRIKVRDGHQVKNKAAHIAVGVTIEGIKQVLGIWVAETEGAKFWAQVCAQLANRGVKDVLIACCDGLTGFPEAIESTWSQATVQTCLVHLIRTTNRFVSYGDRKAVSTSLRAIYTAQPNTPPSQRWRSLQPVVWDRNIHQ